MNTFPQLLRQKVDIKDCFSGDYARGRAFVAHVRASREDVPRSPRRLRAPAVGVLLLAAGEGAIQIHSLGH